MTTQVQIRGAVQATQEARTLAARELDINTTDSRLAVHNGTTAGGIPHANFRDTQNNEWTYASASGTNTITLTLAKAPSAYQAGQRFFFKAAANCTGSATLNVNSLGAKTLKKLDGGALVTLEADDIVSGVIYTATYDGTDFIIDTLTGGSGSGGIVASDSPSGAASSDFDSIFSSGNNYILHINNITASTAQVGIRFTDDNGSTYESSNYGQRGFYDNGSALTRRTSNSSYAWITEGSVQGGSGVSAKIYISNPAAAAVTKGTYGASYQVTGLGQFYGEGGGFYHNSGTALTGVQVLATAGNITGDISIEEIPMTA